MWRGRAERQERRRQAAVNFAEQTANRIAARDQRLRAVGLRVNDDNTVTGVAERDVHDGRLGQVRMHVQFDHFPADQALDQLQQHLRRMRRQIDTDMGAGLIIGIGHGQMRLEVGPGIPRTTPTSEERAAAKLKARATLKSFLSPEQRTSYEAHQYFDVVGSAGNTYRIMTDGSASGNVTWRTRGQAAGKYCAYPKGYTPDGNVIPVEDQFLGQMLQLITDEASYLNKANLFSGNYPLGHPKHEEYARMYAGTGRAYELKNCDCATCQRLVRVHGHGDDYDPFRSLRMPGQRW